MEIIHSIILGAIQGLTELWPISSSGHLVLVPYLGGFKDYGLDLTVILHIGSLVALLVYFYSDLKKIILNKKRLLWFILAASVPGALAGFFLEDIAETTFRNPLLVAVNLIVFGLILGLADSRGKQVDKVEGLSFLDIILIGVAQAIAIIPGVSRSGVTITVGLFTKLKREEAARFSFLLLIPILIGASFLQGFELATGSANISLSWPAIMAGFLISSLVSYLALYWLFKLLKRISYWPFVIYRFILGLVVVAVYLL